MKNYLLCCAVLLAGFLVLPDGPWYRIAAGSVLVAWSKDIANGRSFWE